MMPPPLGVYPDSNNNSAAAQWSFYAVVVRQYGAQPKANVLGVFHGMGP
jgi:hypothetical protein